MVIARWSAVLARAKTTLTFSNWCLFVIVALAVFLRIWHLNNPSERYFDEVYHVPAIELMSHGDSRAFEWWHPPVDGVNYFDWLHPPFAKYIQASSVWVGRELFGSTDPFWWRLPSAIAGSVTVWLVYGLTYESVLLVVKSKKNSQLEAVVAGLIAALIVATDGLLLVQSRIGMNDSLLVLLLIGSLWLFFKSHQAGWRRSSVNWWFGVVVGLAMATKWSAVFIWMCAVGWQVVTEYYQRFKSTQTLREQQQQLLTLPYRWFGYLILPLVVYALVFLPVAWTHGGYQYVMELHRQVWLYQTHRDSNHAYASSPWQWVLNIRPVWYWRDEAVVSTAVSPRQNQLDKGHSELQTANIYAVSHPLLPILGVASIVSLAIWWWKKILQTTVRFMFEKYWSIVWLVGAYVASWAPWFLAPRIMFYYHYAPGVAILACLIGIGLAKLWSIQKWLVLMILAIWLVGAVLWLPQWWGLRVSQSLADRIYFAVPTWR